jgi:EmrB/QacA subfamily drug resistance transporter
MASQPGAAVHDAAPPAPWTRVQKATLLATGLGIFMYGLDLLTVNVALPDVQSAFDVGESGLQWVVTSYTIGMAVFIMPSGTLADRFGRRRLFLLAIVVFTAASVGAGLAPSLAVLTIARTIQGVAAATITVASIAILSAAFDDGRQRTRAFALWTAISAVAAAMGPLAGGFLTNTVSWRSVFFVNVIFAVVVVVVTVGFVGESSDPTDRSVDVPGQVLFFLGIGALSYAVIEGQDAGWTSPVIVTAFLVGGAAMIGFVVRELRVPQPMMDLSLFAHRTYAVSIVAMFFAFFCVYGSLLLVTQFFQNVRDYSPMQAGLLTLPFALAVLVASVGVGQLASDSAPRPLIVVSQTVLIVGLVLFAVGMTVGVAIVLVGIACTGAAAGIMLPKVTAVAMTEVPPERAGMASGILSSQRAIGSTFGFAILGTVLAIYLGATLDDRLESELPDAAVRAEVSDRMIAEATPRAYPAELSPGFIAEVSGDERPQAVLVAAEDDFIRGLQVSTGVAATLAVVVLVLVAVAMPSARTRGDAIEGFTTPDLARNNGSRGRHLSEGGRDGR